MLALTVCQPYASLIASGRKTIETRIWRTRYRGPLLICAGLRSWSDRAYPLPSPLPRGMALCVVDLIDCRPMTAQDWDAACCDPYPGAWAWVLSPPRAIEPFAVTGKQRLFKVEHPSLEEAAARGELLDAAAA